MSAAPPPPPPGPPGGEVLSRRGLPLRWRVVILTALATLLLALVGSVTAFWVARRSLQGDLQQALRRDVQRVVELYAGGGGGNVGQLVAGPTGRVGVQMYDPAGARIAASGGFEAAADTIPAEVAITTFLGDGGVRDWRGHFGLEEVQAALAPFEFGVVAVVADTGFITSTLRQLARALAITALLLALLAVLLGYGVAAASIRPITVLARLAATRGPDRLEPIPYRGPADEVAQLTRVMNDLIFRLKEALEAQRAFLAETSHELRTPLTSLQGFLARAHRRAPPEVRRDLADARRIARTMSRLVEDLLQLSRGQLVQELPPHLVDPLADVLAPVAEEFPGVALEGAPGEALLGDPERLRQLVRNLASNAVRAGGGTDGVTLALRPDGAWLWLEVRDRGPGIPPEQQQRIFEKFYKGAGGGSGLGLAIAKQIAEHHGGDIAVHSVPGDTVFRVRLPAVETGE